MSWQLLIGLSVLFFSINGLLHRVLMKEETSDAYAQTVAFSGLTGIVAFLIVLFRGGLHPFFSFNQMLLFFPMVTVAAFSTIYAFKALKTIEASEYTILITSTKLWFIAGTILFLQETLTMQKLIGSIAILSGVIIAQWRKSKFVLNIGALYILLAAVGYAFCDIVSFYILRNFDATSYIVYSSACMVVALLIIRPSTVKKLSFYKKPKRAANIIIVSINDTIASLCAFLAYQVGRNALQIGPLAATQTMVTVILALIILRETEHMPQKLVGAATVVLGVILLL